MDFGVGRLRGFCLITCARLAGARCLNLIGWQKVSEKPVIGQPIFLSKHKFSKLGNQKSGQKNKQNHSLAKKTWAKFPNTSKFDPATTNPTMPRHEEDWGSVEDATAELERGLEAAADGPPHLGPEGTDGGATVLASSGTEELMAGALSSDDDVDGAGHPYVAGVQPRPSSPPADFQAMRKGTRSLLRMAAHYCATGRKMLQEHRKVQGQADMYMSEVCVSLWDATSL